MNKLLDFWYNCLMKSKQTKKPYMPRVLVKMNIGTRIVKSKKDKMSTRQVLNKQTKEMY